MLSIKDLAASVADKDILRSVSLDVAPGEVHAIMGPNGSGKSTLSRVLAGMPEYEISKGSVQLDGEDLLALSLEERANKGLFLGFQHPVELPGVSMAALLKAAVNAKRAAVGDDPLDAFEMMDLFKQKLELLGLKTGVLAQPLNVGASGGEKKRHEMYQLAVLDPRVAILDEIDSGLDVDAMRVVAEAIGKLRTPDNAFVLVTHYQRLLEHITPDHVHVFYDGRIILSGGANLAHEIEKNGYDDIIAKHASN